MLGLEISYIDTTIHTARDQVVGVRSEYDLFITRIISVGEQATTLTDRYRPLDGQASDLLQRLAELRGNVKEAENTADSAKLEKSANTQLRELHSLLGNLGMSTVQAQEVIAEAQAAFTELQSAQMRLATVVETIQGRAQTGANHLDAIQADITEAQDSIASYQENQSE
jgi:chromosome segregation ATPase